VSNVAIETSGEVVHNDEVVRGNRMTLNGPWNQEQLDQFLTSVRIPMRCSVVKASGFPMVVSLWYLWQAGSLWCATSAASKLARALEQDPRCGFEISGDAPPYKGVRGQGIASLALDRDLRLLKQLINRYLGNDNAPLAQWLLNRKSKEVAICIRPERLMTWDYTQRMSANKIPE
jgi:hypothetical protein